MIARRSLVATGPALGMGVRVAQAKEIGTALRVEEMWYGRWGYSTVRSGENLGHRRTDAFPVWEMEDCWMQTTAHYSQRCYPSWCRGW